VNIAAPGLPQQKMRAIINQKPYQPRLAELRNLGTVLRILLAVNGLALAAAFVREPRWEAFAAEWFDITAIVEPRLLASLLLLYALAPWLERMPYRTGVIVILALNLGTTMVLDGLLATPGGGRESSVVLRHAIFSLLVTGLLLGYFHLRTKALSPAITEARLQALQARIRPHFLFNSINAVLSLVRAEPRRAETALEDLADLFRVLMRDNRQLAPLADEIELCRQYLNLEKLRLGDRLHVEWHIENMPQDALVPPLVLQPLLENAVYHGIEPSGAPGVIAINIFLRRGELHAILRNPYKFSGSHHAGNKMAMDNIRERLALHFDAEARLETRASKDSYEVHIRMPYRAPARVERAHA
jgi:two-component system, LytTR family, sensor histidine kinase AlgZ